MKKVFNIFLFLLVLVSCGNDSNSQKPEPPTSKGTLGILTINDLHGALVATSKQPDIAKLAGEIEKQIGNFDEYIILSGGDMWQGSALSNINKGILVTDILNELGFDGFIIGNHEFDWGVEEIVKFKDGNVENGEADFPFLVANIFDNKGTSDKSDDELVSFAKPYEIYEKGEWTIGVIGYIGSSQKYDIAATHTKNLDFVNPDEIVIDYAKELDEKCDIVIAYGHDAEDSTNSNLTNSKYIDIVYNAHTHQNYVDFVNDKIVMQSGSNGNNLGVTTVNMIDEELSISAKNIHYSSFKNTDDVIEEIVSEYKEVYNEALYGKINVASKYTIKKDVTYWTSDVIKAYTGADFGMINGAGIRSTGLPINKGEKITVAKIYDIMPFDNTIWLVEMTGEKLKSILSRHQDYYISTNYPDYYLIDDDTYIVACCDYIVDGNYDFLNLEIEKTGLLVRDAMIDDIIYQAIIGDEWDCSQVLVGNHYN